MTDFDPTHKFHVGQEVVCVDDKVPLMGGAIVKDKEITEGQIYTIKWLGISNHYVFGEYLGVKLKGVDSRFGAENGMPHYPYNAKRFRPLVSDPLAVFRNMVVDPNGYKPDTPEGPVHPDGPLPDDGEGVKEREKEGV